MTTKVYYNSRVWLNPETSSFTGAMVCFDGHFVSEGKDGREEDYQYIEISDCHNKIRLHCDSRKEIIEKAQKMIQELNLFISHLKEKENE